MIALFTAVLLLQEPSVDDLIRALRSDKNEERKRAGLRGKADRNIA